MVFSKFPRKSRVRPSVCSKRTFSCYFWRKSNQNVGVGCAIKDVGNCLALPHKQCPQKLLSPAAVHTPPHPRLCSFLASSLLIERMTTEWKYLEAPYAVRSTSCGGRTAPDWRNIEACQFCSRSCGEHTRLLGWQNLSVPHATPIVIFFRKHMFAHFLLAEPAFYPSCAHRTAFLPAPPHSHAPVRGYGGPAPMIKNGP